MVCNFLFGSRLLLVPGQYCLSILSFISTLIFFISFCLLSVSFALLFPVKKLTPRLLVFTDALVLGQLVLKATVKLGEETWEQGR